MEPQPADRQGLAPTIDALSAALILGTRPSRRSAARLWPLLALAFTTISLAASAVRVVESSLSESSPSLAIHCDSLGTAPTTSDVPEDFGRLDLDDSVPSPSPKRPAVEPRPPARPVTQAKPAHAKPESLPTVPPKPAAPKEEAKRFRRRRSPSRS